MMSAATPASHRDMYTLHFLSMCDKIGTVTNKMFRISNDAKIFAEDEAFAQVITLEQWLNIQLCCVAAWVP